MVTNLLTTARRFIPLAGRAGWGLLDQAFSSATNFALGILVVRTVPLEEFGAFSLAFSAYLVVVNATRAFPMQPVAIRFSEVPEDSWRRASADALGAVLVAGLGVGLLLIAIGFALGGTLGPAFVALGLTLPGLLVQDGWRSAFFAARRGSMAFVNDVVWAAVLFAALVGLALVGHASVFWLMLVWGGAATVAAVAGVVQSGIVPRPLRARSWWREHRDLGARYLLEATASTGASQAAIYGIGAVAGLASVGALRAALLLFGPLQIFFTGIGLVTVPEGVRALQRSVGDLVRAGLALSVVLAGVALAWGVALILVPKPVGVAILGPTWDAAAPLFGPLALAYAGLTAAAGPLMILRAMANARRSLRANLLASAANGLLIVGAAISGSLGASWGAALAAWLGLLALWRQSALAVVEASIEGETQSVETPTPV